MFKIRETNSDDEKDLNNRKSKYFVAGSILNSDTSHTEDTFKTSTTNQTSINSQQSVSSNTLSSVSQPLTQPNTSKTNESIVENKLTPVVNRKPITSGHTILVNPNQSQNKLLKHLRFHAYEFNEGISPAHYLMYDSCCAIFLSLKYHVIYSNYIYDKLNELRDTYQLKVLLLLVDHIEFLSSLKELTKLAIRTNCTLMLAWSYEEAAHYLENYKQFAERSPDIIMGKTNADNNDVNQTAYQCLVEALTSVKSINKTDAVSLISMFDTFENIAKTDEEELTICPGMASLKAQRLRELLYRPFIRTE